MYLFIHLTQNQALTFTVPFIVLGTGETAKKKTKSCYYGDFLLESRNGNLVTIYSMPNNDECNGER